MARKKTGTKTIGLNYKVPKGEEKHRADLTKSDVKSIIDLLNQFGQEIEEFHKTFAILNDAKSVMDWARMKMMNERLEAMSKQMGGGNVGSTN